MTNFTEKKYNLTLFYFIRLFGKQKRGIVDFYLVLYFINFKSILSLILQTGQRISI